jgi:uncharacterized membrane protein YgaE (UPF0421/DUF939 family)
LYESQENVHWLVIIIAINVYVKMKEKSGACPSSAFAV